MIYVNPKFMKFCEQGQMCTHKLKAAQYYFQHFVLYVQKVLTNFIKLQPHTKSVKTFWANSTCTRNISLVSL